MNLKKIRKVKEAKHKSQLWMIPLTQNIRKSKP